MFCAKNLRHEKTLHHPCAPAFTYDRQTKTEDPKNQGWRNRMQWL